jgi:hypothetical protein
MAFATAKLGFLDILLGFYTVSLNLNPLINERKRSFQERD